LSVEIVTKRHVTDLRLAVQWRVSDGFEPIRRYRRYHRLIDRSPRVWFHAFRRRTAFDGQPEGLTRDDVLDNVTLYWLTNTTVSSARIYWESKLAFFAPKHVSIPVAVSAFPDEVVQTPRSWAESAYPKLIYYNRLEKGGHFAAWEQPEIFTKELRAAFKSLR
jgi:pimeloyl-ACP methyl ester carboxylesterase